MNIAAVARTKIMQGCLIEKFSYYYNPMQFYPKMLCY